MKPTLSPGLQYSFAYTVPPGKTVPYVYEESPELQGMPEIFATAFMVGLMEWTCMQLLGPHLDEGEGSLGVHIDVSHISPTPPGLKVTVEAECIEVKGPRAKFRLRAHDGVDEIGAGTHDRFIVTWDRFERGVAQKRAKTPKNAPEETPA